MHCFSAWLLTLTVILSVSCRVGKATPKQNDQRVVFYVFGSEDIYIVDPKSKAILSTIGPDGICTKSNNRYSRNNCSFGGNTMVRDKLIFFSDMPGNRVHVIDAQEQKVVETIPTEGYPYDLYYLHWLKEVWVHSWTNSTFDVINTDGSLQKTHKAIKAHVQPGWTHGYMFADQEVKDGKIGYVTHLFNPGLHQIDLTAKAYKTFVNVSDYTCTGTLNFVYSSVNKHAFFDCYRSSKKVALLEMDLTTDAIVKKWNIAGEPYVSPDGRYIVALYKSVNESVNLLIASKVYVLVIPDKDSATILKSTLNITGGVSDLVYYEKVDKKGSFIAYISLIYSDKIAVLDLDSIDSGNPQISYIVNVGSVYSAPGMHSVSRPLAASGPWLVTPATADQSLAIINIATQELYGMVKGVVGGRGIAAYREIAAHSTRPYPKGAGRSFCGSKAIVMFALLYTLYMLMAS